MTTIILEQPHLCRRAIYNGMMVTICNKQCLSCKEQEEELKDSKHGEE